MPKGVYKKISAKDEQKIRDEYLNKPVKTLAQEIGCGGGVIYRRLKKWGLEIPEHIIEQRKKESRFSKGQVPFNKGLKQSEFMSKEAIEKTKRTQFKKGSAPHNTKFDGHERITKDGYIEIRLSQGVYRSKHVVEWEKVNGSVKDGYILVCRSNNKLDSSPENWEEITMIENMYRNSRHGFPKEIIPSLVLNKKLEHKLNSLENGK